MIFPYCPCYSQPIVDISYAAMRTAWGFRYGRMVVIQLHHCKNDCTDLTPLDIDFKSLRKEGNRFFFFFFGGGGVLKEKTREHPELSRYLTYIFILTFFHIGNLFWMLAICMLQDSYGKSGMLSRNSAMSFSCFLRGKVTVKFLTEGHCIFLTHFKKASSF